LLQNDTQSFIDFFTRIKKKSKAAGDILDKKKKIKNAEVAKLRKL